MKLLLTGVLIVTYDFLCPQGRRRIPTNYTYHITVHCRTTIKMACILKMLFKETHPSIHFTPHCWSKSGSQGGWGLSQLSWGERRGSPRVKSPVQGKKKKKKKYTSGNNSLKYSCWKWPKRPSNSHRQVKNAGFPVHEGFMDALWKLHEDPEKVKRSCRSWAETP